MRLAYHEKSVAELAEARDVDDRIDDMQQLLGRLETAGQTVRGEQDSVVDQLERIASRMECGSEQLEPTAARRRPESGAHLERIAPPDCRIHPGPRRPVTPLKGEREPSSRADASAMRHEPE